MSSSASPRPSPRTGRGVSRREAILDAATKLFSTRGYADTGIDDIGEAVGVTGPAVYRHFASKQELLDRSARAGGRARAAIVPRVHARGDVTRRRAASPRRPHGRRVHRRPRAHRALLAGVAQPPGRARQRFERVQRELIDDYATIVLRRPPRAHAERSAHGRLRRERAHALGREPREQPRRSPMLQRLLATMAYAALRAADPNPEPSG